jgi:hypothetical protein
MKNSIYFKDGVVGLIPVSFVDDMSKNVFSVRQWTPQKKWLQDIFLYSKFISLLAWSDRRLANVKYDCVQRTVFNNVSK